MTTHKALITGGSGYVGSNLARRLVHDGWEVHIITIPNDNLDQIKDIAHKVMLHAHDGSVEGMQGILASAKSDVVFHLASLFLSEHTTADIGRLVQSNILFGTQLLEGMVMHGGTRIVNTGTSWQHYENMPYSPVNLYAATKQAFEDILQYYVEARGVQAITIKLFDTYGPNDPRPKLFHLLEKIAKEGTTLAMSPGEQMIDLVFIDDVVQAFVMAAERLLAGEAQGYEQYGVSSGNPMRLKDVVATYSVVSGKKLSIHWGGRPYRDREVLELWTNYKLLPKWYPLVNLECGISLVNDKENC
jgi:nucleoside-diphosphate-sugar epimerase